MEIILYQPQIPQNTGNIVRTCKATGSNLVLIPPLGFTTDDRALKRAGLDYWLGVDVKIEENLEEYLEKEAFPFYFFSSHAKKLYTDVEYSPDTRLIFGSETTGLAESLWERWPERFVTLPMTNEARCLNLSNTVAVAVYHGWAQNNFKL